MNINDPPPSYEVATGTPIPTTRIAEPTATVSVTIPEQPSGTGTSDQTCFPLVNAEDIKSNRYSKVCLAVLIFFCFCGALAIIVYFFTED